MAIVVKGTHHPLYRELSTIVGPKYCSDRDYDLFCYSRDSSPNPPQMQGIVVRPANTDEVVAIVKLANYTRTPIVPSGGRASLYGAPPGLVGMGIVVDMTRMRKVLKIDEVNHIVTAEAGCTVAEMGEACRALGWDVHTAWQPYYTDTVGGQISGVLGGGTGLEMSQAEWNGRFINSVKVVLPNGDVVQTGAGPGTNVNQDIPFGHEPGGGPDMTGMFIGDAGIFGIKVEATYRMVRICKYRDGRPFWFKDKQSAWNCMSELREIEPFPFTLLGLIPPTKTIVNYGAKVYDDGTWGWLVLSVIKGNSEEEVAIKINETKRIAAKHGGEVAEDATAKGWIDDAITGTRHREMGSFATLGVWNYTELMAPPSQALECMDWLREFHSGTLDRMGATYEWNDGLMTVGPQQFIFSSIIFVKGGDQKSIDAMYYTWKTALLEAAKRGWVADANQGWGAICMGKYWSPKYAKFIKAIKDAIDPNNIMNPGLFEL